MRIGLVEVFKRVFGLAEIGGTAERRREADFAEEYCNFSGMSIVSVVANKLSNIVCAEAEIEALGRGAASEVIGEAVGRLSDKMKFMTARAFGLGGVVLKPYIVGGRIYTDVLPQDRYFVIERRGEVVTKAGFIAEVIERERERLTRLELHSLDEDGVYSIETKALSGEREILLSEVAEWSDIEPVLRICGVSGMLFSHLKCPMDDRRVFGENADGHGVPVTFGQERLIKMILDLLNEVPAEYRNKRAFIGAEDLLFDGSEKLPDSGLYKLMRSAGGGSESFWEVFSPEIRHSSYFAGIDYLLGLLEKAIGVNKGVLTDLDSKDATATAIKRSMFDTFCLVDAMRKNIERSFREIVYAFEVVTEAFELAGAGVRVAAPDIRFDWSYALLEDSSETFRQLIEAKKEGAADVDDIRRFLGN